MLINTTLLADNWPLIQGLMDGSLQRFGGVVRDASSGQIVKHLAEAPGLSSALMKAPMLNPLGVVGTVADVIGQGVTIHKLNQVQQTLTSVMHVSQIAAAASVLGLGVSVAGFAYMGYKLNQLRETVNSMQERMDARFDRIDSNLNGIAGQLSYLIPLTEASALEQQRISKSLAELHRALLMTKLAELTARLDHLKRFPEDSPKEAIRIAGEVRRVLSDQAQQAAPALEPRVMLVADIAIQGWAVATSTEAQLLMGLGKHREALDLVGDEHPHFVDVAKRWTRELLNDERPDLQTAYRFEAPRFRDYVLPERVERIARISLRDQGLTDTQRRRVAKEADLEMEMPHNTALDDHWTHRQLAIAEYIDGMSEISSRLESVGAFARECEIRGVKSSNELLPGPEAPKGLYVLSAADNE